MSIRAGEFEYEELIGMVEEKMIRIEESYGKSDLPQEPDSQKAEDLFVCIRESFYS